ncbi:phosphonopyruvate decarboxylase [Lederbergia citri]|uniref:Phosphonopyruvate decarboxylase n=1 Tax=Lederbergia citri TaxID=2833580 RepID=A0A942TDZ2_9BACI|nr:phosphonopyruvate decarboxylase [Lederbergia citri]MBS4195031.1 phosphonopyruvate decarboxylase [Lederbergia citri]
MLNTNSFGNELKRLGFDFYSGIPCSFLKNLINYAINECEYIAAVNEGDAVAIASGAYLGGKKPVVLMQNSGLTNAVSPLTSLNYPFQIPVLGFVSLRGEPGLIDEPQHELMGKITTQILDLMQIKWQYLSPDFNEAKMQVETANNWIEKNKPFFFVVKKGTFESEKLLKEEHSVHNNKKIIGKTLTDELPSRFDTLKVINSLKNKNTIQLATTGKTGRELYEIEDSPNNLYMVGSMGCVSSLGVGLAQSRKEKDVIVIDGDGSLLMRMGSLATNGYYRPENMLHILLDNETHDSTGGQSTVSHNVNFIAIAAACGYDKSIYIHSLWELEEHIQLWKKTKGLTFLYVKISKGSRPNLGRPKVRPYEVKNRLRKFINNEG